MIKDKDGKGLTKQEVYNMYQKLNELHKSSGKSTDYTKMREGQEFSYSQNELLQLLEASGYEVVESKDKVVDKKEEPEQPILEGDKLEDKKTEVPEEKRRLDFSKMEEIKPTIPKLKVDLSAKPENITLSPVSIPVTSNEVPVVDKPIVSEVEDDVSDMVLDDKSPEVPDTEVKKDEPLTKEQIDEKITNLQIGEEFFYSTTRTSSWGNGSSTDVRPHTWKRNEDGTLTHTTKEFIHSMRGPVAKPLKTVYSADRTKVLSRDVVGVGMCIGIPSTQKYDNDGKIASVTTDLIQMNTEGYYNNAIGFMRRVQADSRHPFNYKRQEFCNKDGDIILSCKDGKFYNAKGKEIDLADATKILRKAEDKKNIGQLVQYPSLNS